MFAVRMAALIAIGGLAVGCGNSNNRGGGPPQASAQVAANPQESSTALEQSWRAANPGSFVGHVNAVLPARRMISVTDLPRGEVTRGQIVTILLDPRGTSTVEGVVMAKNDGYIQLTYQPLQAGQRDPALGDLAVWYPGGAAVPPGALVPGSAGGTGAAMNAPRNETMSPPPSQQPAVHVEDGGTTTPPPSNPPANNRPESINTPQNTGGQAPAPPTTQPAENPAPSANTPLPAENTAPPTPPTTRPAELNK